MKDPDKQETGIFVLVLIAMAAGILVGFYLSNTLTPQYGASATSRISAEARDRDRNTAIPIPTTETSNP